MFFSANKKRRNYTLGSALYKVREWIMDSGRESGCESRVVPIEVIAVNPHQPRRHFAEKELEELAESIKKLGLIHPPVVRAIDGGARYELISGERRTRAALLAGLQAIEVIIRSGSDRLSAEQALVENIQRVDLNPLEIAKALKKLMEEFSLGQEELAARVGKSRPTVTNYLRLLTLPSPIQESLSIEEISMGHAKALLSLKNSEEQELLYELIVRDDLSVREAEKAANRIRDKAKKKKLVYRSRDFFLEQLAEKIQEKLGTKVAIIGKGKRGRIAIDYYNLDDLDRLLSHFGVGNL